MRKKILANKTLFALLAVCILFAWVSSLSLSSIEQLQGNARVINYTGIVRGATQRLIKQELQGHPNDPLVARLDSIVSELITGVGPNHLIALPDPVFQGYMSRIRDHWKGLKEEIAVVRAGGDNSRLYDLSEEYFVLVDSTVSAAEEFTESQVAASNRALWTANIVFGLALVAGLLYYLSVLTLKRRAELLGALAFTDPLTSLPNRAACNRVLSGLARKPPAGDVAILMFDMNNLKHTNDALGHTEGDAVIAAFARHLQHIVGERGFVGRYGGDEFVSVLRDADRETAEAMLRGMDNRIEEYNRSVSEEPRRLSFAAGYAVGRIGAVSTEELLAEADRNMYARKRHMKEAVLESIMDRIADTSRKLVQVAGEVHASSRDLAGTASEQRTILKRFSEVAATLKRHADEYTSSSEEASSIITEIQQSAQDGNLDMRQLAENIHDIADNSNEINAILKNIDSIAFQTNILALNAAVEAARAGRNGKGFSVVAGEVRALANKSAHSVDTTHEVLEKSSQGIATGLELSRTTALHLEEIVATSQKAGSCMDNVSAKAKEQRGVLAVMTEDLGQVESITDSNNLTADKNAKAAETLLFLAKHLREMLDFSKEVQAGPDGIIDVSRLEMPI